MTCTVPSLPMMSILKSPELELPAVVHLTVGVLILCATLLAAVVDPGRSLAIMTLSLFLAVEWVASQFIGPHLNGYTAWLSSLSVVISGVFWSWILGPAGLFLSTDELIAGARIFLPRRSLAAYCDAVFLSRAKRDAEVR
jgi:ABC-type uncharacterized transport system permease subunit